MNIRSKPTTLIKFVIFADIENQYFLNINVTTTMYATHLHLILTHFPIVGTLVGIGILTYGLLIKNDEVKKVALVIFIIMGILIIPSYFTGEWAKLTVQNMPEVSDKFIESHENFAIKSIYLMEFLTALSIVSLIFIKKKLTIAKIITIITLLVSLTVFTVFIKVGNLGGKIIHTEIVEHQLNTYKNQSTVE